MHSHIIDGYYHLDGVSLASAQNSYRSVDNTATAEQHVPASPYTDKSNRVGLGNLITVTTFESGGSVNTELW